ncbi:hypothetical protein ABZ746_35140 [Streptomyces sp. NPDC020096]
MPLVLELRPPSRLLRRHLAAAQLPGPRRGSVGYNTPGRLASVGGDHGDAAKARAFFVFAAPQSTYDRHDLEQQKALIAKAFAGLGWEVPRLLDSLQQAPELYFDSSSRTDVDTWSAARIGLVGDAACGATIGGMGTGTGVVAANVLAGKLALANGNHRAAFSRYGNAMRAYAQGCQKGGDRTGKFLAPGTAIGLRIRNGLLSRRSLLNWTLKEGQKISTITLPDYRAQLIRLSK